MKSLHLPSIWIGDFSTKEEYDKSRFSSDQIGQVISNIDDKIISSRHPIIILAYCSSCISVTSMRITWHYAGANSDGSIHPAWTETAVCINCGLNSRMRALVDFIFNKCANNVSFSRVYIAERTTRAFSFYKKKFKGLIGSEYLGHGYSPGEKSLLVKGRPLVRHEDLTALSFADHSFDLVITQDVFEHIPNYQRAFAECARVLAPEGVMVFTIPFFSDMEVTRVRASLARDGVIAHHLPPEYHGNPVSPEGSLCFQNFGWDILKSLSASGFSRATASLYWGPWNGHLGLPFFVFCAHKAEHPNKS